MISTIFCILCLLYQGSVAQNLQKHDYEHDVAEVYEIHHNYKRAFEAQNIDEKSSKSLRIHGFGEIFNVEVKKTKSLLHPNAVIVLTTGSSVSKWNNSHPDCFLAGNLTSHAQGTVSLSYCRGLLALFTTEEHEYFLQEEKSGLRNRVHANGNYTITRRKLFLQNNAEEETTLFQTNTRTVTQSIPHRDLVVETALFTDEKFAHNFHSDDIHRRIEMLLLKYNGVQREWSRDDILGYNVTFQIKYINMFLKDPTWYNSSRILYTICPNTVHLPYDHIFMHSGAWYGPRLGVAFVSGICKQSQRCAFETTDSFLSYVATAHETGHSFGMHHDSERGCQKPDVGIMGGAGSGWSTCSVTDMDKRMHQSHTDCLWTENAPVNGSYLHDFKITPMLDGQLYSPDEVCVQLYGSGFEFRKGIKACSGFTCVNMNPGVQYGALHTEKYPIAGRYCGEGKICMKYSCVTWAEANQPGLHIREGGWSAWGPWKPCTRTCGTGISYRRRTCTNPRPLNSKCHGEDIETTLCHTQPCPQDSKDMTVLAKQRSSEICQHLITHGLLNGTVYSSMGQPQSAIGDGQCEVTCLLHNHKIKNAHDHFALLPDGTPCNPVLPEMDHLDWPVRNGYTGHCVLGKCKSFDCQGTMNGALDTDVCGVCRGRNHTCRNFHGVSTGTLTNGHRRMVLHIPSGSYDIQIRPDSNLTPNLTIEIWNGGHSSIRAGGKHSANSQSHEQTFAGTTWIWNDMVPFLYTKGPLADYVDIKVFNPGTTLNYRLRYTYNIPLPGSTNSNNLIG